MEGVLQPRSIIPTHWTCKQNRVKYRRGGAQISAISKSMAKTLGLPIRKLEALLDTEESAGLDVPYLGYTELRLDIPEIAKFDHDVVMMVYPDSKYSHRVPVIIPTLHIDEALDLATYDELGSLSTGWKRGIVGCRIIAKQLSLKGPVSEPMIHKIGGNVQLMKVITMAPQQAIKTMSLTEIPVLSKRVNIATEAIDNLQDGRVELLSSYESIKPGSQRVAVALYNNACEKITLKKVQGTFCRNLLFAERLSTSYVNCFLPGFLVPLCPKRALVWGNGCERFCTSRSLLGSYVHQESI